MTVPSPPPDAPYLSIVLSGRNDDFGGSFAGRLIDTLDFNHRQLAARGISHEIVLCEWDPVAGRPWLADVLADRFPDLVPDALTSYVADAAYHEAYSHNPRLQFQEFIAKNIGIRRSRGQYVLTTNADVYFGRGVLDALERRALSPGVLYRARRIDLKGATAREALEWDALEDPRNQDGVHDITPPLYSNASGDFLLLDRASYCRLRGFNEVSRVARVHVDYLFCLKAYGSGLSLVPLEGDIYHVGRGTLASQWAHYRLHPAEAPWGDVRRQHGVVYENADGWGLADAPSRTVRPGVEHLAFSWSAVPPLVALSRVVMPGERLNRSSAVRWSRPGTPPYPVAVRHRDVADQPMSPGLITTRHDPDLARARLAFIASLELPLAGRRVLDVGCGGNDDTSFDRSFYTSHGCQVTGLDGRRLDLTGLDAFDIVHCVDLLHQVEHPVSVLRGLAGVCREVLLLETVVCDATASIAALDDGGPEGLGCRPSPSYVAMALDRAGFRFVYGTTCPPEHADFAFDWRNDLASFRDGRPLRCMFVASRQPLSSGHLLELVTR